MKIRVVFHAGARALAGVRERELEVPEGANLEAFWKTLVREVPELAPYREQMKLALNGDFAEDDATLASGSRVDLLPPVAGGAPEILVPLAEIRDSELSLDEVWKSVVHSGAGAVVLFTGVVRDHIGEESVSRLEYEAYAELANKEMRRVLERVAEQHPGTRLSATHRVGDLRIGDLAVVVGASAAHRGPAFEAGRAAIDQIKETVPIWKREWRGDGQPVWVNLDPPTS